MRQEAEEPNTTAFSFASFCRTTLNIRFIDGLKLFFPSNEHVKFVHSTLEPLTDLNDIGYSEEVNKQIPHLIKINKDIAAFLKYKFEELDGLFRSRLVRDNVVFAEKRREQFSQLLGTTTSFVGTYVKYSPMGSNITTLLITDVAKFISPGDIMADHIWIRLPRLYNIPYKYGHAYKFTGEVYRYKRSKDFQDNRTDYDYGIKRNAV